MNYARPCASTPIDACGNHRHAGGHSFGATMALPAINANAADILDVLATSYPSRWILRRRLETHHNFQHKTARRACARLAAYRLIECRQYRHDPHLPELRITPLGVELIRAFYT